MPIIDKLITENTIQIVRPVSDLITRSLLRYLGIYHIFRDSGIYLRDPGTGSVTFDTDDHTHKVNTNMCVVDIEPNFDPSNTEWDLFTYHYHRIADTSEGEMFNHYQIFYDKRAKIYLSEVLDPCSVTLNFELRVKSIELAEMILNSLYTKFMSSGGIHSYTDVEFNYPVPDIILVTLYRLYSMREFDTPITFQDYLKYGSNDSFDLLVNRDGDEIIAKELVVNRIIKMILAKLTIDSDKPEDNKRNNVIENQTVSFKYVYQFGKPRLLRLKFPIMVDNKMVPEVFIGDSNSTTDDLPATLPSVAITEFFGQANYRELLKRYFPTVKYPHYDDWDLPYQNYQHVRRNYILLFSGLMAVDTEPVTNTHVLSIDIVNDILPFIKEELRPHITEYINDPKVIDDGTLFHVTVFDGNNPIPKSDVTITNGVLEVRTGIDPSRIYRVTISLCVRLPRLSEDDIRYVLENNTTFAPLIASHINFLERRRIVKIRKVNFETATEVVVTDTPIIGDSNEFSKTFRIGDYIITCLL